MMPERHCMAPLFGQGFFLFLFDVFFFSLVKLNVFIHQMLSNDYRVRFCLSMNTSPGDTP